MYQQVHSALSESAHRVLFKLASFLPGLLALLLAVLLLTLIGAGLAALLRRILTAIKFDERLARSHAVASMTSIQDWSPSHSPAALLTRAVFWGCVALGFIIGLSCLRRIVSKRVRNFGLPAALSDSFRRRNHPAVCG